VLLLSFVNVGQLGGGLKNWHEKDGAAGCILLLFNCVFFFTGDTDPRPFFAAILVLFLETKHTESDHAAHRFFMTTLKTFCHLDGDISMRALVSFSRFAEVQVACRRSSLAPFACASAIGFIEYCDMLKAWEKTPVPTVGKHGRILSY
jgi:hypothetical protein